jgi:hypothetical protein
MLILVKKQQNQVSMGQCPLSHLLIALEEPYLLLTLAYPHLEWNLGSS